MRRGFQAIWLFAGLAAPLTAASPFSLKLPDLSDEWFPAGAVIRVPNSTPAKEIVVRITKPAAHAIAVDRVEHHFDGRSPNQKAAVLGEDYLLMAVTRETHGFLRGAQHEVCALGAASDEQSAQWTLMPEDRATIEAQVAGANGDTISIAVERPAGLVQLLPGQNGIRVKVTLSGGSARTLHIAAVEMAPKAGARLQFEQEVPVPSGRDFALWAEDASGSYTKIVLRVLPSGEAEFRLVAGQHSLKAEYPNRVCNGRFLLAGSDPRDGGVWPEMRKP
jgi:hypothetical protein